MGPSPTTNNGAVTLSRLKPGDRASQGGSVDWFRFWLQDYEDPDPAKKEQYVRWRELRKLQEKNEATRTPKQ